MDPKHEEFLRQLEWIDDDNLEGMHEPGKIPGEAANEVFSKNMVYRGLRFKIHLYKNRLSYELIYDPDQISKGELHYSERIWERFNQTRYNQTPRTRKEFIVPALLSTLIYLDWILDSTEEEFERVGMDIVKTLKKTQKTARTFYNDTGG